MFRRFMLPSSSSSLSSSLSSSSSSSSLAAQFRPRYISLSSSGSSSSPIIPVNALKRRLQADAANIALGTMIAEFRQPSIMTALKNSGFNFCIIDNEHGPFGVETIADLSRAAVINGITPIVRVPDHTYPYIAQSLDGGAQGLMFPRIFDAHQVEALLSMTLYPPNGRRGSALGRGFSSFLGGDVAKAMAAVNCENFTVVQIETAEAVTNIEAIVSVPGVDCVLIGPNDLSIALGVPGQLSSSVMELSISRVIDACHRYNVIPGLHINNLELLTKWRDRGMRLLSYNSEIGLLMEAAKKVNDTVNQKNQK